MLILAGLALANPNPPPADAMSQPYPGIAIPAQLDNVAPWDINAPWNLSPAAGEEGHWTAVRFDPLLDFSLREIRATFTYDILRSHSCVTDIAHDVMVFTSSSLTPPTSPTVLGTWTFPAIAGNPGANLMSIELTTQIHVAAGDQLYVAFELAGALPDTVCLLTSEPFRQPDIDETEFWSFSTTAPFPWESLDSLGPLNQGKPVVSVVGLYEL